MASISGVSPVPYTPPTAPKTPPPAVKPKAPLPQDTAQLSSAAGGDADHDGH